MNTKLLDKTGLVDVTESLQHLIDEAAEKKEQLIISKGTYLVASLFLKNYSDICFEDGAVLLGTIDESKYPIINTRVAGIEMDWYPGLLNINNCHDVKIRGKGIINGQGAYWWKKFWGEDKNGGMLVDYVKNNLRWACDYDCKRVRGLVVMESKNIELSDFDVENAGFWNVHICYSEHVHIDGITIHSGAANSPSTDGIDIDSSSDVVIENVETHCHDDSICIKSGRDCDGYRVGRPCHDVLVQNCNLNEGFGITIGSEVSGGVYNITFKNINCKGTECGFRIKSSINRSGYIKNIKMEDVQLEDVAYPIYIMENWYPKYSICSIPENYKGKIPEHWKKLCEPMPAGYHLTEIDELNFKNIKASYSKDFSRESHAFTIEGFVKEPIKNIFFTNIDFPCSDFGSVKYVDNLEFENSRYPEPKENYSDVETTQLD